MIPELKVMNAVMTVRDAGVKAVTATMPVAIVPKMVLQAT
jgi:hypothetical protein